ncbi:dihydroorotase, mitochondrial-like isoform X2 [Trifolium pratense]|uniref:dihydroorotase, mitochondrial-like isoform X2 n=1 Tax=Trifolium pratense TaxID=57577 RepID=UPI001E690E24|nr:dihydroorotase, mitochondrial-like isoform X2 [Trifolium pratense]
MKTKTEKGRVRICFLFLHPSLSKSLFLSHPPPPAAALNPSLTALNLSPSPRRNAVQSSAAAAPLLSSPRRTTPHRTHSFSSSRFSAYTPHTATEVIKADGGDVTSGGSNSVDRKMEITITQPDDFHLHLRDGALLEAVTPHSAKHFQRAIIMPNLKPPITTTSSAISYRESILKAVPKTSNFTPLMTLYLTDVTTPHEIQLAKKSGVVYGVKLYPAGATTNSQDGVTDLFGNCYSVLEEMVEQGLPLLVHGEVTNQEVDIFDREKVFIETVLEPLIQKLPQLKVVMEHITTMDAVKFVESCKEGYVAATVTPQHILLNRNALFQGGLQPHNYCLPVLKREIHSMLPCFSSRTVQRVSISFRTSYCFSHH